MTQILKADTAVKVVIGPVVAVGDGFTPVTTLALSTADEAELMKHDAAAVTDISGNTFAAIASMDGYYNLTLTAAQLDTEGMLTIAINDDSLCLPVKKECMVVNANVYDSLYAAAATDVLDVNVTQVAATSQTAGDLAALVTTVDTVVDGIQADLSNGTDGLGAIKADTAAILVDTADMQPKLGTPAGTDMSADIAAVKADTAAILLDTAEIGAAGAGLTALASAASIAALNDPTAAAIADAVWDEIRSGHTIQGSYGENFSVVISGTVDTITNSHTPTTTEFQADDITEATADHFIGRVVIFTTGVLAYQATDITDYANVGGIAQFTVTAFTEAPSNNDQFIII